MTWFKMISPYWMHMGPGPRAAKSQLTLGWFHLAHSSGHTTRVYQWLEELQGGFFYLISRSVHMTWTSFIAEEFSSDFLIQEELITKPILLGGKAPEAINVQHKTKNLGEVTIQWIERQRHSPEGFLQNNKELSGTVSCDYMKEKLRLLDYFPCGGPWRIMHCYYYPVKANFQKGGLHSRTLKI